MSPAVRAFGKYLLDEEIARGGMSRVFLARLRGLGGFEKRLVVKQVLPELASDPRFVSMFVTEAKTLVQMSHPHIAPVYELGVVDGVYFLAMEYVEGATLAGILKDGPLPGAAVAHVGAQIADALHYAHSRFEIIHRDVTPKNVMVDPSGHSRLLDFGVATPNEDDGKRELFGTPGYMSPEHLSGSLGPGADVFSLGAVLYQALTGRRAFRAKTVNETRTLLASDVVPGFEPGDDVSDELAAIVLRALDKDPEVRFESARDLARTLRGWLALHAPEGVGPDLGLRAERAVTLDDVVRDVPDEDGVVTPAQPSEVKTLATSPLLRQIIEAPVITPASTEDDEPGTKPIEGRVGSRASDPDAHLDERDDDDAPVTPARIDPPPREGDERAPSLLLYAAVGSIVIGAAVWAVWPGDASEADASRDDAIGAVPDDANDPPSAGTTDTDQARTVDEGVPTSPDRVEAVLDPAHAERENAEQENAEQENAEQENATLDDNAQRNPPERAASPSANGNDGQAPMPAPSGRAVLTVGATPWAEVDLDGRPVGNTPQRRLALRAGRHTIELRCPPLGARARTTFEIEANQSRTVFADLSADPPTIQVR